MPVTLRKVRLPNGREAIEYETQYVGGSETQADYEYRSLVFEFLIDVSSFSLDYWGRVEGLTFLD